MKFRFIKLSTILMIAMLFALKTSWADNAVTGQTQQPVPPAYATGEEPFQLETGFGIENLSTGNTWREAYVTGTKVLGKNTGIYGTFRDTNRFNLEDQELSLGGYAPLGPSTTLGLFGSVSTGHVLADYSIGGNLTQSLGGGNDIGAGYQYRKYTPTGVNIENFTFDHYFTNNTRLAYTIYFSQLTQPGTVSGASGNSTISHTLTFSDYYTNKDSFNIALTVGAEADSIGQNTSGQTAVELFNVRGISIYGEHWFNPDNGLTYGYDLVDERGVSYTGYNNSFTRNGPRLGFIHNFETTAAAAIPPSSGAGAPPTMNYDDSVVKFRIFDWAAYTSTSISTFGITTGQGSLPGYGLELNVRGKDPGWSNIGFGLEYTNNSSNNPNLMGTLAQFGGKLKYFITPRSSRVDAAIYADYFAITGGIKALGGGLQLGYNFTDNFSLDGYVDYSGLNPNANAGISSGNMWRQEVIADFHPTNSFLDFFLGYRANTYNTTDNAISASTTISGLIVGAGARF